MNPRFTDGAPDEAELFEISRKAVEMLRIVRDAFVRQDRGALAPASELGREIHRHEKVLTERLVRKGAAWEGAEPDQDKVFVPMHLERIGDYVEGLIGGVARMITDDVLFTGRATTEISSLMTEAIELLESVQDALRTGNRTLIRHLLADGPEFEAKASECAMFHEQRLIEGVCVPRSSSVYVALIDNLKGIAWHARQIGRKLDGATLGRPAQPGAAVTRAD
jgi:Na+/phosphate symporter